MSMSMADDSIHMYAYKYNDMTGVRGSAVRSLKVARKLTLKRRGEMKMKRKN